MDQFHTFLCTGRYDNESDPILDVTVIRGLQSVVSMDHFRINDVICRNVLLLRVVLRGQGINES